MKITLKTGILIALLAFFIIVILSNFSNFEGFTASDSSSIGNKSVVVGASPFTKAVPSPSGSSSPTTS